MTRSPSMTSQTLPARLAGMRCAPHVRVSQGREIEGLLQLQADIEAYTAEMEVIGAAYEDMQAKNSRLLQQLAEKDGKASQVLTEKIQAQHQANARSEQQQQAEAARKLAEQQVAVLQERVAALEAKLQVSKYQDGAFKVSSERNCIIMKCLYSAVR